LSLKERELKERELKLKEREKNLEHQFNVVVSDCFFAVCQVEYLVGDCCSAPAQVLCNSGMGFPR